MTTATISYKPFETILPSRDVISIAEYIGSILEVERDAISNSCITYNKVKSYYSAKGEYLDMINIDVTEHGEYLGYSYTIFNFNKLKSQFGHLPGIYVLEGDFGYSSIIVDPYILSKDFGKKITPSSQYYDFREAIEGLANYPIIDDMGFSEFEHSLVETAIDDYLGKDLISEIESAMSECTMLKPYEENISQYLSSFFPDKNSILSYVREIVDKYKYEFINEESDRYYLDTTELADEIVQERTHDYINEKGESFNDYFFFMTTTKN